LSAQLPPLMRLGVQDGSTTPQLKMALEFIEYESEAIRPGYVAVADRLMDLLFIQILRSAMLQPTSNMGIFLGLTDANISRALEAIHTSPAENWTVARLAREAGQSRTIFAQRFREIVGVPPMKYVSQWRLTIAEDLLTQSDLSIEAIRSRLGFGTSFAFARAFSARCGMSPREFRRISRSLNQAHDSERAASMIVSMK
jgi:AraC-like DNA-binding protein